MKNQGLTLDLVFLLQMVVALYAKGANSFWEHALIHPGSSGKITKRKPNPRDPVNPNKNDFIRAKYALQSFIHRPSKDESPCTVEDLSQVNFLRKLFSIYGNFFGKRLNSRDFLFIESNIIFYVFSNCLKTDLFMCFTLFPLKTANFRIDLFLLNREI